MPGTRTRLFPGYVATIGQQLQVEINPLITVNSSSVVTANTDQSVTLNYRWRYFNGSAPEYVEAVATIEPPDRVPSAFSFTDITDAEVSTQVISESITPGDYNEALPISIVGGEYSLNGDTFTSVAGEIIPRDNVTVRTASPSINSSSQLVTLDIGGVTTTWTVTTLAAPPVSSTARPLKARFRFEPASDDGKEKTLYAENTNLVVAEDLSESVNEEPETVISSAVTIRNESSILYGPASLISLDSSYALSIPANAFGNYLGAAEVEVNINSESGGTGNWCFDVQIEQRKL